MDDRKKHFHHWGQWISGKSSRREIAQVMSGNQRRLFVDETEKRIESEGENKEDN